MPGLVPGTESTAYYTALAETFGLRIEITASDFGAEPLLDVLAGSGEVATLVGARVRLAWPVGHDLRRIEVGDPAAVYPHSLLWHRDNPHPALAMLGEYLRSTKSELCDGAAWTPEWARPAAPARPTGSSVPPQERAASHDALVRK